MAHVRLLFACTFFLLLTPVILSHKNDPLHYDMDKRFPFKQSTTTDDQECEDNEEDESEDTETSEQKPKRPKKPVDQIPTKKITLQQLLVVKKRKPGPSEGH